MLERCAFEDLDPGVLLEAVDALPRLSSPARTESLERLASMHEDAKIRNEAAEYIGRIPSGAARRLSGGVAIQAEDV